ncbi:hypothetical protein ABEB36_001467 [Hypothenemus hampei]|uniref:Uncharacterized protein n=1 Tax=Hypothenemus hampei TaxID=57062 RepID=A0ABD1FHV7_HYPHA
MDVTRLTTFIICWYFLKRTVDALTLEESEEEEPTDLTLMGYNMKEIPFGTHSLISSNFAYNRIQNLVAYELYRKYYKNLEILILGHNLLSSIHLDTFREIRQLKRLDLSFNNLTSLEPNTFRYNTRLEKLDLTFNNISFDQERPFLKSLSIKTLLLSHNEITHVFDISFAKIPNLEMLLLDGNPLFYVSKRCFAYLHRLEYVNLAHTNVYRLVGSMFTVVPRLVDLTETNLAKKFEPPLRKVRSNQLIMLINIDG